MKAGTGILAESDEAARLAAEDAAARREGALLARALWLPAVMALAVALGFSAGVPLVQGAGGGPAAEAAAIAATLAAADQEEEPEGAALLLVLCVPAAPDALPADTPIPTI